jgi:hypothetical protein
VDRRTPVECSEFAAKSVFVNLRTPSLCNLREHWSERQRRARSQRETIYFELYEHLWGCRPGLPAVVTLTRFYRSLPLDDDNLRGALKSVRDGVADYFGVDDGDPRIRWDYAQEKGSVGIGVRLQPP